MWENFDPLKKIFFLYRQFSNKGVRLIDPAFCLQLITLSYGICWQGKIIIQTHAIQFAATPCSCSSLAKKDKSTLCLPYRLFFQCFSRPKSILLLTCSQQISQEVRGETIKSWCEARPNCYLLVRPPVATAKGFEVAGGLGGYLE